jgi:DNA-binding beta-propeller fold protein YncE
MIPLFGILAACTTIQPASQPVFRTNISWPLANSQGRVVWVKNIANPSDIGTTPGFWQRMSEMVSGTETSTIGRPYGVLRTEGGALYLTDPGRHVVHCLDISKGTYSRIESQEGSPLLSPIGLTEDTDGRVYITDSVVGMVYRYTKVDGSLKPFLSQPLERPTGIAFNPVNKLLYVADTLSNQIIVLDKNSFIVRRITGRALGGEGFNRPTDLVVDARGQIYVTDSLNFRITLLTPEGQVVRQFGSPGDAGGSFSRPKGIAVDSSGNIYVNDSLMDAVQVFDQNGDLVLVFGKNGTELGQFWMPSGLFIDHYDQIYVADTYNRRIQVFRYLAQRGDEHENNEAVLFDKPFSPTR